MTQCDPLPCHGATARTAVRRRCCSKTRIARGLPAHLCRACGGRGCRCHVKARILRARHPVLADAARPVPHARLDQILIVTQAPRARPCRPQAPPAAFSGSLKTQFGKGHGHEGPFATPN